MMEREACDNFLEEAGATLKIMMKDVEGGTTNKKLKTQYLFN